MQHLLDDHHISSRLHATYLSYGWVYVRLVIVSITYLAARMQTFDQERACYGQQRDDK